MARQSDSAIVQLLALDVVQTGACNDDRNTPLHYFCECTRSRNARRIGQVRCNILLFFELFKSTHTHTHTRTRTRRLVVGSC